MGSKSTSSTRRTVYGSTTTSNPYAYSKTNNDGTTSGFQKGTAFQSIYDFVNKSANSLLEEYLNPNLNTVTNQAKLNSFANTLSSHTRSSLENDIINSLSKRNLLRSSQANDLYKNLANQNAASVANYANDLISNSQESTAKMLSNLLSYYMLGSNYLSGMQNNSLSASQGNATQYNNSNGNSANSMQDALMRAVLVALTGTPI